MVLTTHHLSDFRSVQADGRSLSRQERTAAFEKGADLASPSFLVVGYSWTYNGKHIDLQRTQDDVISATPLKNGLGVVVEQASTKFGPDNVVVLNPDGTQLRRITNPYPTSIDFKPGDQCRFVFPRCRDGELVLGIEVSRHLPGQPHQWTPQYECRFDTDSWALLELKWVDSRAW